MPKKKTIDKKAANQGAYTAVENPWIERILR